MNVSKKDLRAEIGEALFGARKDMDKASRIFEFALEEGDMDGCKHTFDFEEAAEDLLHAAILLRTASAYQRLLDKEEVKSERRNKEYLTEKGD